MENKLKNGSMINYTIKNDKDTNGSCDTGKVTTWIPEKRLFYPFKFISVVNYSAGCVESQLHSHDFFQSVLVISGQFIFISPYDEELTVNTGEIAVIPNKFKHRWKTEKRCKTIQIASVPILTEDYGDLSALWGRDKNEWLKVALEQNYLKKINRELLSELKSNLAGDSVIIHSRFLELFAMAFRAFAKINMGASREPNLASQDVFGRALEFIHANYRVNPSLHDIAKNSFLGVSRFSEIFRKHTGMSPIKYLISYKMEKAKTLLSYSDMSVSEVAEYLGFESIHYFSKAFKTFCGTIPSSVRASRKK